TTLVRTLPTVLPLEFEVVAAEVAVRNGRALLELVDAAREEVGPDVAGRLDLAERGVVDFDKPFGRARVVLLLVELLDERAELERVVARDLRQRVGYRVAVVVCKEWEVARLPKLGDVGLPVADDGDGRVRGVGLERQVQVLQAERRAR